MTAVGDRTPAVGSDAVGTWRRRLNGAAPRRRRGISRVPLFVAAVVVAAAFVAPLAYAIVSSLKTTAEANASPPTLIPGALSAQNYGSLVDFGIGIFGYVRNSVVVTGLTIVGTLVLSVLGGYGFARFQFPGKSVLFILILATMMIPFQSIIVPLFVILNQVGLTNSLVGLALVYITFQLPFSVFVMRNSFAAIPREIEDAAVVDGAGTIRTIVGVMAPIAVPGMVTVVLFAFLAAWNEFLAALILLTQGDNFTLPIMLLSASSGPYGTVDWGMLQAAITVAMVPALVLFLALQRYYLEGLSSGAVKV
jgi:multiple sugar transport system permease protein